MNEQFAADPCCIGNSSDLKNLLEKFGVFTGRYLLSYPKEWESLLARLFSSTSPLEVARMNRLLQRSKESCGIINMPMMWMDHLSWVDNARRLTIQRPPKLDGLVVPNDAPDVPYKATTLDNFVLPPTAEERIASTPEEYIRVMKMLLLISHELILVDPYLSPCNRFVSPVMDAMLAVIAATGSKCRTVHCYARTRDVLTAETSIDEIKEALQYSLNKACTTKPLKLNYYLLDDSQSRDRMHDRYLMSVKGGVQLSQGFQTQRGRAKVTVSPMSPAIHKEIWGSFMDRKTDMRKAYAIELRNQLTKMPARQDLLI